MKFRREYDLFCILIPLSTVKQKNTVTSDIIMHSYIEREGGGGERERDRENFSVHVFKVVNVKM